jgi:hypothetical protein
LNIPKKNIRVNEFSHTERSFSYFLLDSISDISSWNNLAIFGTIMARP